MSYNEDGFEERTQKEIIKDKEDRFGELFDVVNNSVSDIMFQWMKLAAAETQEIEMTHQMAAEQMSISNAQGAFLDKWGIECGISRKGESKAEGYVEATYTINGDDYTLSSGTTFSSASHTYDIDEEITIPYSITMNKNSTGESSDFFPTEISEVESIEKIEDVDGNTIPSDIYALNSYNNGIEWETDSSSYLVKNQEYEVYFDGDVTKRIEVAAQEPGPEANINEGRITSTSDANLSVTNKEPIDGGSDEESDSSYRQRLLQARRRSFTLGSIRDIVLDMDSVRSTKVYQNTGVDQAVPDSWDDDVSASYYYELTGTTRLSQTFSPGDHVATLGKITLHGNVENDPPSLYCGIKGNTDQTGVYYDTAKIHKYDLDQTHTGNREIEFRLKYNGLDKTKDYRFDVWCEQPDGSFDWEDNHWKIGMMTGDQYPDDLLIDGSDTTDDLMFKTHFNAAGYTIQVAPNDGYGFENIEPDIEDYLDYVEEGGYSPVCIQFTIYEANEIDIDIKATIYTDELSDFQNVRREVSESLEEYLEGLIIGDNVVYSRIYQIIMDHDQVYKLEDLEIKRHDKSEYSTTDLGINDDEIPDLGSSSFQRG